MEWCASRWESKRWTTFLLTWSRRWQQSSGFHDKRRAGHPLPGSFSISGEGRMTLSETDWNAVAYDDLSEPMFEWGLAVLETLELHGDERVLDAGCGSARLTEELLRKLPV